MAATAGTLLVLDFSGTLSVAAPHFAAPDVLRSELERTGLADLGVSPEVFWDEIVNPTWVVGSTTARGYAAVLVDALCDLQSEDAPPVAAGVLRDRAEAFTARYLAASTIAPEWGGWLRRFAAVPGVAVVIATDHYAEATGQIVDQLRLLGISGAPLADAGAAGDARVIVANSADLGCHKSDPAFWRAVRGGVGLRIGRVVLVDDFGANEHHADAYADGEQVRRRRAMTVALLRSEFGADVVVHDFALGDALGRHDIAHLVERAGRSTMTLLSGSPRQLRRSST